MRFDQQQPWITDYTASMRALLQPIYEQNNQIAARLVETMRPTLDRVALVQTSIVTDAVSLHMPVFKTIESGIKAYIGSDVARLADQIKPLPSMLPTFSLPRLTVPMPSFTFPTALTDIVRGFDWEALERRLQTPRNWPEGFEPYLPDLLTMLNDEGIPVAWVPRWELLEQLIGAGSAEARSELLVEKRQDIVGDCAELLEDIETESLLPMMPSVEEILEACRAGLWKAAALAAVPLIHSVVESLEWVTDRQRAQKYHAITATVSLRELMERATRAPLVLFYDDWNPLSGQPRPMHLARHVMSHRFGPEQVTDRNCVVAVMLLTSLFVTVDQLGLAARKLAA